ncbi:SDR family NAD(P)-dependent oxidoreductase [Spongiactinospora rosea]|uniref:SDR family NAD(P)-dependent oxidoreductase n=1 Tax=Spongiactinospora rosea TaxID=2248750 RepID=A0A366LN21_9ACTN|nr:SDR family oxidoreductase [Spongiactinospora rosea]RBQ14562.1 SDR family NAD(P)-dependent oxidoreductase [Spongiactinospora rosea]
MATGVVGVTGASGQLGGRIARRLAERGASTRLVVRDPARAPSLPGAETAVAAYQDPGALRTALDGVGTLLLVSATEAADRREQHVAAVDAAVAAGVTRIVYTSFTGAAPDATFTFARDHWHTEQHIRETGVGFTFLRDNLYLDLLPLFAGEDGVIRGPAGEGRAGVVARDDIADAAVAVLLGEGHDGATYDLTGPQALTMAEVAAEITRATGRKVTYQAETLEEAYASRAVYGAPQWEVDGWVTSYSAIAAGELDLVTDAVATLTGHPPISLADHLAAHRE